MTCEGLAELPRDVPPGLDALSPLERPARLGVLQLLAGQPAVVPVEHGHLAAVLGGSRPERVRVLPPAGGVSAKNNKKIDNVLKPKEELIMVSVQ